MKRIAIIISEFNKEIGDGLLAGTQHALHEEGVPEENIKIFYVPGAFEIPLLAAHIAENKKFDGVIALGAVLEGETDHYRAVCDGVTYGIQKVAVEYGFPIMFGVLMCKTRAQAIERSQNNHENKGYQCGKGLLKMLAHLS